MLVETVWEAVRKTREGEHWEVVGHKVGHRHGGRGQGDAVGEAAWEYGSSWLVVLGRGGGGQLGWGWRGRVEAGWGAHLWRGNFPWWGRHPLLFLWRLLNHLQQGVPPLRKALVLLHFLLPLLLPSPFQLPLFERVERALGEILNDKLLGDVPGLPEEKELLEDERLLLLGHHVPPVEGGASGVLGSYH